MTEPGTNRQWRALVKKRDARITELRRENERLARQIETERAAAAEAAGCAEESPRGARRERPRDQRP